MSAIRTGICVDRKKRFLNECMYLQIFEPVERHRFANFRPNFILCKLAIIMSNCAAYIVPCYRPLYLYSWMI